MKSETINKIIKQIKENKWIHYLIIIIIGIILSVPLNKIQIRNTHDGSLHMLRLLGTADTLEIGQFPPLINQNYCNGAGYAMNLFYQPLVTYLPLLVKLFVPTYMETLKIYGAICIIASGITMYQFVYQVTKKRSIALFSSIFYLIAPYKLANIYSRFAIGEFTAMVFIPLVFLGIYNLFNQDKKKHYYISIGAIGLMLSHTVTTLYTAIFCIIYILFNIQKLKDKEIIKKCIINVIFILLVSMLFWLPLLEATSQADYAIMDDETMRTTSIYTAYNTISFKQLFKDVGEEVGTTFLIGIPTIFIILLTPFIIKKVNNKYKDLYLLSIIFSLISVFMASRFFPWQIMPNFICKLQYPWRMIGYFNLFISFVCGINLYLTLKYLIKKDSIKILVIIAFIAISIFSSIKIVSQFFYKEGSENLDKEYEDIILANKKISHMAINRDYMPLRAIKLQKTYVRTRKEKTYILEGKIQIIEENKKDLKDEIKIKDAEEGCVLELPYYYYPGYKIELQTEKGIKELKPVESEHGYLSIVLQENVEEGIITVEYVGTTITYISYITSAISLIIFICYIIYERKKGDANDKS